MTEYNPIADALDGEEGELTIDDMEAAGYDDWDVDPANANYSNVAAMLASALEGVSGLGGDDSVKWGAVNDIVGAMRALEHAAGVSFTIERSVETRTVDPREEHGLDMDPYEVEVPSYTVSYMMEA